MRSIFSRDPAFFTDMEYLEGSIPMRMNSCGAAVLGESHMSESQSAALQASISQTFSQSANVFTPRSSNHGFTRGATLPMVHVDSVFDVVVIGAGAVGCAIAREVE